MSEQEYIEITRRIQSRIYKHTHTRGSNGTYATNKAKADEDVQILKILEKFLVSQMNEVSE